MRRDVALPDLAGGRLEHLALACRELRVAGADAPLPPTLTSLHLLLEARALKHLRRDPGVYWNYSESLSALHGYCLAARLRQAASHSI